MEQPSWTDVWGIYLTWISLGISFLSLVAAGVAVWKLFVRDKEQVEAMISLTKMSNHYAEMLDEERKTRLRNIRPFFHIVQLSLTKERTHKITLRNLGETAFVTTIGQMDEKGFYRGTLAVSVMTKDGECVFSSGATADVALPFIAFFRDIDGNLYEQYFTSDGMSYRPHTPVLKGDAKVAEAKYDEIKKGHVPPFVVPIKPTY